MLYYIIVGAWEYLFFHTSPTHTAAAVKAKAANKDVSRRLAYETENFYPEKIKQKSKSRDETRRDEMFRDEAYEMGSGFPPILKAFLISFLKKDKTRQTNYLLV